MYHKQRWTPKKIKQRLELLAPFVYIQRKSFPSFRYRELDSSLIPPLLGKAHLLALHGWTGLGDSTKGEVFTKSYMRQCAVVQIHQLTRELMVLSRITLETAQNSDENQPARYELFNALNDAFISLDTLDPLDRDRFYESVGPTRS